MRIEKLEEFMYPRDHKLQEFMDSALKSIKKSTSGGSASYSFVMKGDTPEMNEYHEDIIYSVNFEKPNTREIPIDRPDIFEDSLSIKIKSCGLTFSNNMSRMSELGGKDGFMTRHLGYPEDVKFSAFTVYGTIGRILYDFITTSNKKDFQAINFCTAHPGLVKPYLILTKEAERKAGLISNVKKDFHGQSYESFFLIRKETIMDLKTTLRKMKNADS